MLPEILSNQACSLRPQETKLCFAAVFELDEKANVLNEWFQSGGERPRINFGTYTNSDLRRVKLSDWIEVR